MKTDYINFETRYNSDLTDEERKNLTQRDADTFIEHFKKWLKIKQ